MHELPGRAGYLPDPGVRLAPARLQEVEQVVGSHGSREPGQPGHPDGQPGAEHLAERGQRRAGRPRRCRSAPAGRRRSRAASRAPSPAATARLPPRTWPAPGTAARRRRGRSSRAGRRHRRRALVQQHADRGRRVGDPAVPAVPVPRARRLPRQRGRGRADQSPGRRVGQRLDGDQGADDRLAPLARRMSGRRPSPATSRGVLGQRGRLRRSGGPSQAAPPDRANGTRSPALTRNSATATPPLRRRRQRPEQPQRLGSGEDAVARPPARLTLGWAQAVLEPGPSVIRKVDLAADALEHPQQHRVGAPRRHAVGQPDGARGDGELGLQHQGVRPVTAPDPALPSAGAIRQCPCRSCPAGRRSRRPSRTWAGRASRPSRPGSPAPPCAGRRSARSPRSAATSASPPPAAAARRSRHARRVSPLQLPSGSLLPAGPCRHPWQVTPEQPPGPAIMSRAGRAGHPLTAAGRRSAAANLRRCGCPSSPDIALTLDVKVSYMAR